MCPFHFFYLKIIFNICFVNYYFNLMKRNVFIFVRKRTQLTSIEPILATPALLLPDSQRWLVSPKLLRSSQSHQIRQS